jgi:hypothetical protein
VAEEGPLLHDSQIGGRRKKTAVDIAILLASSWNSSVVFLDVKGAFDYVAKGRLL